MPITKIHDRPDVPDSVSYRERAVAICALRDFLAHNRADVLELLTEHTSYKAAESELSSAIRALDGAIDEVNRLPQSKNIERMAVFMPSNVILYSYVLYLVIPSLYTRQIDFRPASVVTGQSEALHRMLSEVHRLPITMQAVSQRIFMEGSVKASDIVLFTGTYANAEKIRAQLKTGGQVFVFFGQGINPIVVGETADLDKAVGDIASIRLFNTGQDCMGPDVIFVHQGVADTFVELLKARLKDLKFGSRKDKDADYSPIYYSSTIELISQYLMRNATFIQWGGGIDYASRKIEPTVLYGTIEEMPEIVEFFGPVFNIVSYENDDVLKRELTREFYKDRAMGASLYGSSTLVEFLERHHSVSVNATLFDIEDGNKPFGGYGQMANYVYANQRLKIAPILLSQVVAEHF